MADPPTGRLATRSTNANQHPGRVVPVRKRHTKAEMERDKALQEEKKIPKKRCQQNKGIEHIAELEDQMAIDDASAEGAHPQNRKGTFVRSYFLRHLVTNPK